MEQTERQSGQQNRRFLAVFAGVVDQLLTEQPFLENRSYDYQKNNVPDVRLHGEVGHAVRRLAVGKHHRQHAAEHTAGPHHRQAHKQ